MLKLSLLLQSTAHLCLINHSAILKAVSAQEVFKKKFSLRVVDTDGSQNREKIVLGIVYIGHHNNVTNRKCEIKLQSILNFVERIAISFSNKKKLFLTVSIH